MLHMGARSTIDIETPEEYDLNEAESNGKTSRYRCIRRLSRYNIYLLYLACPERSPATPHTRITKPLVPSILLPSSQTNCNPAASPSRSNGDYQYRHSTPAANPYYKVTKYDIKNDPSSHPRTMVILAMPRHRSSLAAFSEHGAGV